MPEKHRKQCKRFDVPGDRHFLTFSCDQRRPYLSKDRSRRWMIEAIARSQDRGLFDLWAYVIMPEHVHLVLLPGPDVRIASILKTLKQSVSRRANIWLQQNEVGRSEGFRFWQRGGGYDRNLRSVQDIHEKIDYIHQNPIRRGLCVYAVDWFWSSARAWVDGVDNPLAIQRESVPRIAPRF